MSQASDLLEMALARDQFDDTAKRKVQGQPYYAPEYIRFILRHASATPWLDIGCGSGEAFNYFPITHAVEPNPQRRLLAQRERYGVAAHLQGAPVKVYSDYAEALSFPAGLFSTVTWLFGFFQCRSEAEALISVNIAMHERGVFIFDVPTQPDTCFGRAWHEKNLIEWLRQFGFELKAKAPQGPEETRLFAFEKIADFGPVTYLKPQLHPVPEHPGQYTVSNSISLEYWAKFLGLRSYKNIGEMNGKPVIFTGRKVNWRLL